MSDGATTDAGTVRIEVLGPLRVRRPGGGDGTPSGALQRRLLSLLVLRRGRVVGADAAVDVLWPNDLPRDPAGALQNHVSRLRTGLPVGAIESIGDGYRLDPAAVELDADRVVALVGDASAWDDADRDEAEQILASWRGPAYVDLAEVDDARAEATRLDELRIRLREEHAADRLRRARTDGLTAELAALVEAEPLRERPRALLIDALVAEGRHAEALRAYDDFRRRLGDELGIEPSAALTARHADLLVGGSPAGPTRLRPRPVPEPTTSLFGRDELVDEVVGLVDAGRLVSLVGTGGVGKTRLLLEVAGRLAAADPSRPIALCELATADGASVPNVVAASLDIDVRPGVPLAVQVAGVVGEAEVILLADNCEHVIATIADLVDDLLRHCPNLRVVATSRERLRVAGEHVCTVPTLPVVDESSEAIQLFVDRARSVVADLELDDEDMACVEQIVRRLDGLPLAIELAAACLHTNDIEEVLAGLDRRFSLLTVGARTSPRHESLAAAVEWSFELLDVELRRVFTALSVFAGSFDVAGAAAVCGWDEGPARDALAQLTERSLVVRAPGRRYVLLETLREFGIRQLEVTGRSAATRDRHARFILSWAADADGRLAAPGSSVVAEIDDALPELHAALGWLLDTGDVEAAGRLVGSLLDYGVVRLRPDVLGWADRVAAADPDDASPLAPLVLAAAAYATWMTGDVPGSGVRGVRALESAARAGVAPRSEVLTVNGNVHLFEGRVEEAGRWYRRAVDAARAADDPAQRHFSQANELLALGYAGDPLVEQLADAVLDEAGEAETPYGAYVWYCAGEADLARGQLARAHERLERAIALAAATGSSFVAGLAGASKASIDARLGDPVLAARDYRQLIAHWRRSGMWSTQWTMLRSIAGLVARLGQHRDAAVLVGAIRATDAGHRIFGNDEVALAELTGQLRDALGDEELDAALAAGALLDGDATVEHALRVLALTSEAAPR